MSFPQSLTDLACFGIRERMFPGCVGYASRRGEVLFHEALGSTTYDAETGRPVQEGDLFDLASLTKLYTAAVVLRLAERGVVRLGERVSRYVPEVEGGWTIEDLLAHRTGATSDLLGEAVRAGIRPCEAGQEAALWGLVFASRPAVELAKGESHYSDVDFLLAQAACERATGRRLDKLLAAEVLEPLGLRDTCFRPPDPARCVPTEFDSRWRRRLVVGEVHDEVAATLGGVAGHAGLFATAADVGRFCQAWLAGRQTPAAALLPPRVVRRALRAHSRDFALGWRRCNESFFPTLARHGAVGHLGFTGTSAFVFPRSRTAFVLLSNRVHPRRDAAPSRLPLLARMGEAVAACAAAGKPL